MNIQLIAVMSEAQVADFFPCLKRAFSTALIATAYLTCYYYYCLLDYFCYCVDLCVSQMRHVLMICCQ